MKIIIILFLLFIGVNYSGICQSKCGKMSKGIDLYNSKDFKEAIKVFKTTMSNSIKGDDCYIKSCLWIGKSYFNISSDHPDVSSYLGKAISYVDIEALRFYALEFPYYDTFISDDIEIDSYLKKFDNGEIYYLIGNIYAKKQSVREDKVFSYLEKSINNGFSGPVLFTDNYIKKINPSRYDEIVVTFEIDLKVYVEKNINLWQKKGKFEKTATYRKRVNEEYRTYEIKRLTQFYIDSIGAKKIDFNNAKNEYDADNEVFKITFDNLNSIYLPVPISEAKDLDKNFISIVYEEPIFTYSDNKFEILHLEVINPITNKRYIYDSKELIAYNSSTLLLNFDKVDIDLNSKPTGNNVIESSNVIIVGKSDVDENIPTNTYKQINKYALIIGNEDYTQYQSGLNTESNVDFARTDATIFSKYCEKTLGVPKENIVLLTDAISSQIRREIEKLVKLTQYSNGEAEIIFYYSGHGFPHEQTKESYIMPVDISGSDVESGIKLSDIYSKLSKYPSKKVTIFLDACFSGSGRNQGLLAARGVKIVPKAEQINGNIVVFSASSGEQSALPYSQKQHGMFTYFLLKKLQERKGIVSYGELSEYIKNQVQLNSIKINNKDQNPQTLFSPEISDTWVDWKFINN
jgi:hypothetical protein